MTLHDFKTILAKVPKEVEIMFAGMAEPWLNKWASDMVLYAHNQGYKVGAYTTTVGMKMEDIVMIADIPFQYFTVHLPDADGLMKLTVDKKYLQVLSKVLEVIDCQTMCIGKLHPEVEKITGPVADGSVGLLSRAGNIKTLAINKKKGKLHCTAMSSKMDQNILLPNGDVLLCCCDYAQQHVIGNLLKMPYEEIHSMANPEYAKVIEGLEDDESDIICRKCELSSI